MSTGRKAAMKTLYLAAFRFAAMVCDFVFQVFEFMQTDLEIIIKDKSLTLSPADVKSYIQMVLQGLDFCHKRWVLHRDVKPNNFLISANGVFMFIAA